MGILLVRADSDATGVIVTAILGGWAGFLGNEIERPAAGIALFVDPDAIGAERGPEPGNGFRFAG
jgi:hypothetical protein